MEVLPAATAGVGRFSFPSELLWRYPIPLPPQMDFRTQLPRSLGNDPRQWSRESVASFLQWCQFEFDLPQFNMDKFQMNGKALCLLTKADLAERSPGSGDVLHNVLQMLVRDSSLRESDHSPLAAHFPRPWPLLTPAVSPHAAAPHPGHPVNIAAPPVSFSVTLSPVPSKLATATSANSKTPPTNTKPVTKNSLPQVTLSPAPPTSPCHDNHQQYSHSGLRGDQDSQGGGGPHSPVEHCPSYAPVPPPQMPSSPSFRMSELSPGAAIMQGQNSSMNTPPHSPVQKLSQFSLSEPTNEPNSNGRLLWDFLQQLLNDSQQRYTAYIAWKNREVGVFKIVDPPGLAKLWGIQKNHLSMNYDKMSRALRYYYRVNILRKVQGERHCYQFLRNPSELRSIKNMSMLRQQVPPQQNPSQIYVKSEPQDVDSEDIQPTDLSKGSGTNGMWATENSKSEINTANNNNNNNTTTAAGMKLQLNMWTQENGKADGPGSPSNTSNAGANVQPHAIKTEDTS